MSAPTRSVFYWGVVCLCAWIAAGGALLSSGPAPGAEARREAARAPDEADLFRLFEEAASTRPLIGFLSLAFGGLIVAGAVLDLGILWRAARRRSRWRSAPTPGGEWGLAEVLKAALLFLAVYLALDALAPLFRRLLRGPSDVSLLVLFQLAAELAAVSVIAAAARRGGGGAERLGLSLRGLPAAVAAGTRAYVCFLPVMIGLVLLTRLAAERAGVAIEPQAPIRFFFADISRPALVALTLFVAVGGPVCEELFFRGFAYQAVRRRWGRGAGVLVTALVFSAIHANAGVFPPILGLGILLACVFEATGSLYAPITVHICQNGVAVAASLLLRSLVRG